MLMFARIRLQLFVLFQTVKMPPPLAGHTLTLLKEQESEHLLLIGGFSPAHGFLDTVWNFNLETESWDTLKTSGNGPIGGFASI